VLQTLSLDASNNTQQQQQQQHLNRSTAKLWKFLAPATGVQNMNCMLVLFLNE